MTVLDIIIDDKHYALDTDEVLEYSPYSMPEHGDSDPSCIEGSVMHGDDAYAVVDMRKYLKLKSSSEGFLVYLRQKEPRAALHVDEVNGVYMDDAPSGLELLSAAAIVRDVLSGGTSAGADASSAPPDNSELEAALTAYVKEHSSAHMERISQLLRTAHVFVPGMLDDKKQPRLSLIKDKEGRMFMPAFTSQKNVPMQPKPPAVFCIPFADLSRNALGQGTKLAGVMINPGQQSVVISQASRP